ncbi:M20/M25/M40 family metallo-hydrolase [Nocardiopsis protaetiae]|uniref:M20/M25/M40 family metallo-hydrolase n=1 Tax=Nocardiopsis protaetiae TaxID=3382270 RepID=UPI00387AA0AD
MTRSEDVSAEESPRPRRRATAWAGALGALLLLLVAALTVLDQVPPAPAPADAPAGEFSADRAHAHIERFAARPHPLGTGEHDRTREYLVAELAGLGLEPEVHEAWGVPPAALGEIGGLAPVGRVRNIVAVIEGTDPTGRVLLAAHYDSVPAGPGANDDGAGVAAILEVARALTGDGAPPRNDVVLLLTDGEEVGLLGAEAYTADHPDLAADGVVLNHEARGSGGTVIMFRATPGAAPLIRTFAAAAPYPVADSTTAAVFEFLPNDTDFTAFRATGLTAMDFAYAGGSAHYHSVLDSPEHVDRRSLQQMGANTLALTRVLAAEDLAGYTADGGDLVYFNLPPDTLLYFPAEWALPLAVVSLLFTVGALVFARVRRETTVPRLLAGSGAVLLLLALAGVLGALYWWALVALRPGFADLLTGTPYEPLWPQAAAVVLTAGLVALWYLVLRRVGAYALALGALLVLALLGTAGVLASPGLAPVLVPVPFAALGALAALAVRDPDSPWRRVLWTAGLVPTAVWVLAAAWIAFDTGLEPGLYTALPLAALGLVLAVPLVAAPRVRWLRAAAVPALAVAASAALVAAGTAANPGGAAQPLPTALAYTLDADTGEAFWTVPQDREDPHTPDAWAAGFVSGEAVDNPAPEPSRPVALVGAAEAAALDPPELEVLFDESADGERTLRLALASPRGAEGIVLAVDDADGRVSAISVEGREVAPVPTPDGVVGVHVHAPPAGTPVGVEVRFAAGGGPLAVRLADVDRSPSALADLPGYTPPPPDRYLSYSRLTVTTAHEL